MIYLDEINNEITFSFKQAQAFLKACKGSRYECFLKMIMTYGLSRMELVCLEWNDVDFENNTINDLSHFTRTNKPNLLQMGNGKEKTSWQNFSTSSKY